jgi:hypothetical protein
VTLFCSGENRLLNLPQHYHPQPSAVFQWNSAKPVRCTLLLPENYCQDNDGYENP